VVYKTSEWLNNWEQPGLNNFRQNVPGTPNGQSTADPTAGASSAVVCGAGGATLKVDVCNRGADAMGAGVKVGFYDGAQKICETETTQPLQPGECEQVSCLWHAPERPRREEGYHRAGQRRRCADRVQGRQQRGSGAGGVLQAVDVMNEHGCPYVGKGKNTKIVGLAKNPGQVFNLDICLGEGRIRSCQDRYGLNLRGVLSCDLEGQQKEVHIPE